MLYLDLAIAWLVLPVLVFALLLGAARGGECTLSGLVFLCRFDVCRHLSFDAAGVVARRISYRGNRQI